MTPQITVPRVQDTPTGIRKIGPTWHVVYYRDGKKTSKAVKATTYEDALEKQRDFYQELLDKGATYSASSGRKKGVGNFIDEIHKYRVRIPDTPTRSFDTREEAEAYRDALFIRQNQANPSLSKRHP